MSWSEVLAVKFCKKKEYKFTFPQNSKIITFDKNFEESNHRLFGKSKSIKKLVSYIQSLNNSEKFTNLGNMINRNLLFNVWHETGLSNHKNEDKFYSSLDMDILEFCSKIPNYQIVIFSSDPDIIQVVKKIRNNAVEQFQNKTFENIRIISFNQNENKRSLKIAA